jgi:hypothetical protein
VAQQEDWPPLQVGQHLTFDDGACLMELVSVAAGEPWSDHPASTHPLLAHVARQVNDATSDGGRAELVCFVRALSQAGSPDTHAYARIAAACTQVALAYAPSNLLRALHAAASRRCNSDDPRRHLLYNHGMAFRSVDLAALAVQGRSRELADHALREMLSTSLEAVTGALPSRPSARISAGISAPLTVRQERSPSSAGESLTGTSAAQ